MTPRRHISTEPPGIDDYERLRDEHPPRPGESREAWADRVVAIFYRERENPTSDRKCASCGVPVDQRSRGCATCDERHRKRRARR